mmetsp:Transcript_26056/g.83814  ORF Transcript_26056/g.83814 Transcript_26056/m.83814 type:complete len:409 (+) Transcript_26056:26-1252(+)
MVCVACTELHSPSLGLLTRSASASARASSRLALTLPALLLFVVLRARKLLQHRLRVRCGCQLICSHWRAAQRTAGLLHEHGSEGRQHSGEVAARALRQVVRHDVGSRRDAHGNAVHAAAAVQVAHRHRVRAEGAVASRFLRVLRSRLLAHDRLDLALELGVDLGPVLGPHQHGRVREGGLAKLGTLCLDDCRRENRHRVLGELADVLGHPHQQPSRSRMVAKAHVPLDEQVGVEQLQRQHQRLWDALAVAMKGTRSVQKERKGELVVPELLLLPCNDDGSARGMTVVLERHVHLENVLGVLGNAILLAHQVVGHLVRKHVALGLTHHLDGLIQHALSRPQEQVHRLVVLPAPRVVAPRLRPLLPALEPLRDALEVFRRALVAQRARERADFVVLLRQRERLLRLVGHE